MSKFYELDHHFPGPPPSTSPIIFFYFAPTLPKIFVQILLVFHFVFFLTSCCSEGAFLSILFIDHDSKTHIKLPARLSAPLKPDTGDVELFIHKSKKIYQYIRGIIEVHQRLRDWVFLCKYLPFTSKPALAVEPIVKAMNREPIS